MSGAWISGGSLGKEPALQLAEGGSIFVCVVYVCRPVDNFLKSVLSSFHVGPRNVSQVIRLGGK